MFKVFENEQNDNWIVLFVLLVSVFTSFDFFSDRFSWMAFHERDFSRACNLILHRKLSYLGPELSDGGYTPGPALTLLFSVPVWLAKSPRGIHVLIQSSFILALGMTFSLVKKYLNRSIAYVFLVVALSSYNYVLPSFAGWHASLILFVNVLILFIYDRYWISKKKRIIFLIGIIFGIGIQFHVLMFLLFLWYLLWLVVFSRKEFLNIFIISLLGVLFSLVYYFYNDYQNGFYNTKMLLSHYQNFNQALEVFNLESLKKLWFGYSKYMFYIILSTSTVWFGHQIYTGWVSVAVVVSGVFFLVNQKLQNRMQIVRIIYFLLFLMILPVFAPHKNARFFLLTHPAFEVLLSIIIYYSLKKIEYKAFRISLISVFCFIFGLNFYMLTTNSIKYLPIDSYAIFYKPFRKMESMLNSLIVKIKISPETYKNKFYVFDENSRSLFLTDYPRPSYGHYELAYYKKYPLEKNGDEVNDVRNGVILTSIDSDLKSVFFDQAEERRVESFGDVSFLFYKSLYFYRQAMYAELSSEEILMLDRPSFSVIKRKQENSLYVDSVIEVPTKYKTIRYLQKLDLKNDLNGGMVGYSEIVSSDLRQLYYSHLSPYFIKNPTAILFFRDGTKRILPIMQDHLYSQIKKTSSSEVYSKYGNINKVLFLGNMYVMAPYGSSIKIKSYKIEDIKKIMFLNEGYGSTEMDENSSDHTTKVIDL